MCPPPNKKIMELLGITEKCDQSIRTGDVVTDVVIACQELALKAGKTPELWAGETPAVMPDTWACCLYDTSGCTRAWKLLVACRD